MNEKSGEKNDNTLIMIRPRLVFDDRAVSRIHQMISDSGLVLRESRLHEFSLEDLKQFYPEAVDRIFWRELVEMHVGRFALGSIFAGDDANTRGRQILGSTLNPNPGTVRFEFGTGKINPETNFTDNGVHGSDSQKAFINESQIFFSR